MNGEQFNQNHHLADPFQSNENSIARRSFLKRSGGVTTASILSWQLPSLAEGGEGQENSESCSTIEEWCGYDWECYDFYNLSQGIRDDMSADLDVIITQLTVLSTTIAALSPSASADTAIALMPFDLAGWFLRWKDAGVEWTIDVIKKLVNFAKEALLAIVDTAMLILPVDQYSFKGTASQFGTTLGAPDVDGPGNVLDVAAGVGWEIQDLGLEVVMAAKAGFTETRVKGFKSPAGPGSIDVECKDEGPETVAERMKAFASVDLTVEIMGITATLKGEEDKNVVISTEIKPGEAEKPKKPEDTPCRSDDRGDAEAIRERLKQIVMTLSDSLEPFPSPGPLPLPDIPTLPEIVEKIAEKLNPFMGLQRFRFFGR